MPATGTNPSSTVFIWGPPWEWPSADTPTRARKAGGRELGVATAVQRWWKDVPWAATLTCRHPRERDQRNTPSPPVVPGARCSGRAVGPAAAGENAAVVTTTLLPLLAFVLLTAANAGFVLAEFSLVTVDRAEIERQAASGDRAARTVQGALRRLSFQLSGAQLGITIAALLTGYLAEPALAHLFE